jgi:hypothetical protein
MTQSVSERASTAEQAVAAFELQQLIVDYCHELDLGGLKATTFFTEDGVVDVGKMSIRGRAEMQAFYQHLAEHIRKDTPGGSRTSRHVCANLRFSFENDERATVTGLITNYSGAGAAPLLNATVPTVVSEVRFECRRDTGRRWLFSGLYGSPVFLGNDPMQTKALVGNG